ncbi:MAG: sugar nucleotidyltransferase [Clostridia bacterium]|nr:sugar nucleotidyltransferase [Clostridia bacterium]
MEGLILAAGKGSRLSPDASAGVCKALVEVEGAPLITYSLENLIRLGVRKATVVVGNGRREIESFLGDRYKGIRLAYAVQEKPLGLVNAIVSAKETVRSDVVLQLSDEIFLRPMLGEAFLSQLAGLDFAVGYTLDSEEKIKRNFSIETDENMRLLGCKEKPQQVSGNRKGTGFCWFSRACWELLVSVYDRQKNSPNDLCDYINLLIADGKTGKAIRIAEEEINVNTPGDLLYAQRRIRQENAGA